MRRKAKARQEEARERRPGSDRRERKGEGKDPFRKKLQGILSITKTRRRFPENEEIDSVSVSILRNHKDTMNFKKH